MNVRLPSNSATTLLIALFALLNSTGCVMGGLRLSSPGTSSAATRSNAAYSFDDEEGDPIGLGDIDVDGLLIEAAYTPRDGNDDDVWGLSIFGYPERGFGIGLQVQGTLANTDPELDVVLTPPSAELAPRTREFTVDFVATYRVAPYLGAFAGAGLGSRERFRRFEDAIGNDFFVSDDEDLRANLTAGAHLWLAEFLTVSTQWDSIFEAATFGVGIHL